MLSGKMTKKLFLKVARTSDKTVAINFVNLSRFNVDFLQSMVPLLFFSDVVTKCFQAKWRKTPLKVLCSNDKAVATYM